MKKADTNLLHESRDSLKMLPPASRAGPERGVSEAPSSSLTQRGPRRADDRTEIQPTFVKSARRGRGGADAEAGPPSCPCPPAQLTPPTDRRDTLLGPGRCGKAGQCRGPPCSLGAPLPALLKVRLGGQFISGHCWGRVLPSLSWAGAPGSGAPPQLHTQPRCPHLCPALRRRGG